MATTANVGQSQDFGPILAALDTLKKTVPQSEKAQASKFLETFQKSVSDVAFVSFASSLHPAVCYMQKLTRYLVVLLPIGRGLVSYPCSPQPGYRRRCATICCYNSQGKGIAF